MRSSTTLELAKGDNNNRVEEWKAPDGLPPPIAESARKLARLQNARDIGTLHAEDLFGKSNHFHFPFKDEYNI
jgi:hypothetical protein